MTDNVEDVSLLEGQPCLSARNVLVVVGVVVEQGPEPQPGLPDQRLVLVGDQLERDRVLSCLLENEEHPIRSSLDISPSLTSGARSYHSTCTLTE